MVRLSWVEFLALLGSGFVTLGNSLNLSASCFLCLIEILTSEKKRVVDRIRKDNVWKNLTQVPE